MSYFKEKITVIDRDEEQKAYMLNKHKYILTCTHMYTHSHSHTQDKPDLACYENNRKSVS